MNMPTIENEYNIIKEYYDEVLNKDSSLVKTSNDKPTPITCVEEMVNKIPDDFWKREDIKIIFLQLSSSISQKTMKKS